jgi:hypothetical protein
VVVGNAAVVMPSAAGLMLSAKAFADIIGGTALSFTWIVKLEVPADVGVPLIGPDGELKFRVKPAGNEPPLTVQL